jgi:hypothetical protein
MCVAGKKQQAVFVMLSLCHSTSLLTGLIINNNDNKVFCCSEPEIGEAIAYLVL